MQALRKQSPPASLPQAARSSASVEGPSPEKSASATSGTYFRAVRPAGAEADAHARGEPTLDVARAEGLRFELDMGIWRPNAERIAERIIDDGCQVSDADESE